MATVESIMQLPREELIKLAELKGVDVNTKLAEAISTQISPEELEEYMQSLDSEEQDEEESEDEDR